MEQPQNDCLSRLLAQLRVDSGADTPPWTSDAIALAPTCGTAAAPWLARQVTNDEIGFLALEALRMHFRAEFAALSPELRAATYARRLATGHWYNVWGLPREAPSESALALVDIGPVAIPFLAPLLDSKRPAPSFGSEEATMSRLEGYRVCDYAWVFISRIEGQQPAFPAKPEERDLAIEAMTARLRRSSTP